MRKQIYSIIGQQKPKKIEWGIRFLILLIIISLNFSSVHGAVDLLYFRAKLGTDRIILEWATASELDISGFFVLRSLNENAGYARISPFIFAVGDSLVGASYEYVDSNISNGIIYYYKLEVVPTNVSQGSQIYGPISASIGGTTPTATKSPTPILTTIPTSRETITRRPTATRLTTGTPSPTLSSQPTQNPYPGPINTQEEGSSYPNPTIIDSVPVTMIITSTLSFSQTTSTLIPFPEITILFPESITPTNTSELIINTEVRPEEDRFSRYWLISIVILLWLLSGYIIFRLVRRKK